MQAVILAADSGKRLHPVSVRESKACPRGGEALWLKELWRIVDSLTRALHERHCNPH